MNDSTEFSGRQQLGFFHSGSAVDFFSGLSRAFTLASGGHWVKLRNQRLDPQITASGVFNDGCNNQYLVTISKLDSPQVEAKMVKPADANAPGVTVDGRVQSRRKLSRRKQQEWSDAD